MIWGWTTCLTYETKSRLGFDHFDRLLDEMAAHDMGRLTIMPASHYHYDLANHGLAWPVHIATLAPAVDRQAINADSRTEFLSRILARAHLLGIEVVFEVKYAGVEGAPEGYPGIEVWTAPDGRPQAERSSLGSDLERRRLALGHICHDGEVAHRFMRDQLTDLLELYPDVDGIVMEWPGYAGEGCFCAGTLEKFRRDTGVELRDAPEGLRLDWQNGRVRDTLHEMRALSKKGRESRQFGLFTGLSPADGDICRFQSLRGHRADTLREIGLDFVMPYCEGRHREREEHELARVIDYLSPLPCHVHCTIRRNPPGAYPLPPKDPAYIHRVVRWARENHARWGDRFAGMSFFNEVNIPEDNRAAVYAAISGVADSGALPARE